MGRPLKLSEERNKRLKILQLEIEEIKKKILNLYEEQNTENNMLFIKKNFSLKSEENINEELKKEIGL